MRPAYTRFGRIINACILHPTPMKFFDTRLRRGAQCLQVAELDGLGGTSLRACRNQACLLPVVAERAFEGATVDGVLIHNAERTGDHAVSTAIADIRLK